ILGRKEADAHSPILLVSDAAGTSDFPEMTSDLRAALPQAAATVLVRGSDTDDALHQRFLEAARLGPALVDYTRHAPETFWAGNIHTVDDATSLAGGGTSLWAHMTCVTAFFQDPRRPALAVATLLAPSGGAWGAWGSTGMPYPGQHSEVDQLLAKGLLLDGKTLGEATRDAMANVSDPDLRATFVLLGDPSARAVAQRSPALQQAPRSSGTLGCSIAATASTSGAALLLLGWLALLSARGRVSRRQ